MRQYAHVSKSGSHASLSGKAPPLLVCYLCWASYTRSEKKVLLLGVMRIAEVRCVAPAS